jgi:hypothetical protein
VAEDDRVGALEARPHAREPARPLAGVVDHRDPRASALDHPGRREHPPQRLVVDVAVDAVNRRPELLEHPQHLDAHEVAGVQDRVGAAQLSHAFRRQRARAAGHVGVGDDGDAHGLNGKLP